VPQFVETDRHVADGEPRARLVLAHVEGQAEGPVEHRCGGDREQGREPLEHRGRAGRDVQRHGVDVGPPLRRLACPRVPQRRGQQRLAQGKQVVAVI
jgi:hypothetical protein